MIKGCLISAAVAFAIVVGAGVYLWTKKDAIVQGIKEVVELPDHGKEDFIKPRYGDLFAKIDEAANGASTRFEFAAAVEKLKLPEVVVYVGFKAGAGATDIVKRKEWNGRNTLVMNGYGAGNLNLDGTTIEIMIYENPGPWTYMDGYVVYLEHKPEASPAQAEPSSTSASEK